MRLAILPLVIYREAQFYPNGNHVLILGRSYCRNLLLEQGLKGGLSGKCAHFSARRARREPRLLLTSPSDKNKLMVWFRSLRRDSRFEVQTQFLQRPNSAARR